MNNFLMQYSHAKLELNVGSNRDSFCHFTDFSNCIKETTAKIASGGKVFLNAVETAVNDGGASTHINVMASSAYTDCNNKKFFNILIQLFILQYLKVQIPALKMNNHMIFPLN